MADTLAAGRGRASESRAPRDRHDGRDDRADDAGAVEAEGADAGAVRPGGGRSRRPYVPKHARARAAAGPRPVDVDEAGRSPVDVQRRRFTLACAIGFGAAWLVFAWLVFDGGRRIFPEPQLSSTFYEIQARALMRGDLHVPPGSLSIEGFEVDGRTYQYFGPLPAVLRIPVLWVTDSLDGKLTPISMAIAAALAGLFASMLLWRVRRFVRGPPGVAVPGNESVFTRTEFAATAMAMFAFGIGSALAELSSRQIVYYEADCWAIALAMGSLWAVLGVLDRLTYQRIALAGLFALLAFITRATLGLVSVITLAVVTVAVLLEWLHRRRNPEAAGRRIFGRTHLGWGVLLALAVATVLPVAVYAKINHAKFDSYFRIPIEKQVFSRLDPHRMEMLEANDNSYFRPVFIPTTALTYLRPDGIRLSRDFPFFWLPEQPPTPAGEAVFDRVYPTAGLLPTMPFWAGLAGWGLFCAARPHPRCRASVKRLRVPLVGAAAGSAGVLTIAYIAPRYLGDFLPFLVLAGAIGLYDLVDRTDGRNPWVRRGLFSLLALLATLSVLVNVAIAYSTRSVEGTPQQFHDYLLTRYEVSRSWGDPMSDRVLHGDELPRQGPADFLFIRGDCDALYWTDGIAPEGFDINNWRSVERGERAGEHHVGVRFVPQPPGTKEPLLGVDDQTYPRTLFVEWLRDNQVRFGIAGGAEVYVSEPVTIDPDHTYDGVLVADGHTGEFAVTLDGEFLFQTIAVGSSGRELGVTGDYIVPEVPPDAPPPTGPATSVPPPASAPPTSVVPWPSVPPTTVAPWPTVGRGAGPTTTARPVTPTSVARPTSDARRPGAQRAQDEQPPKPVVPDPEPDSGYLAGAGIAPRFSGTLTPRPNRLELCEALRDDLRAAGRW